MENQNNTLNCVGQETDFQLENLKNETKKIPTKYRKLQLKLEKVRKALPTCDRTNRKYFGYNVADEKFTTDFNLPSHIQNLITTKIPVCNQVEEKSVDNTGFPENVFEMLKMHYARHQSEKNAQVSVKCSMKGHLSDFEMPKKIIDLLNVDDDELKKKEEKILNQICEAKKKELKEFIETEMDKACNALLEEKDISFYQENEKMYNENDLFKNNKRKPLITDTDDRFFEYMGTVDDVFEKIENATKNKLIKQNI